MGIESPGDERHLAFMDALTDLIEMTPYQQLTDRIDADGFEALKATVEGMIT